MSNLLMSSHATRTKIGSGALRNWRRRQATRLEPPTSLSEAERTVFIALVNSCGPTHFKASDMPLLSRYCEQTVLADLAAIYLREEGAVAGAKVSPWVTVQEKAIRGLVALSMRLRLSPQARLDPKTLGRQQTPVGPKPWEMRPTWMPGEKNDDDEVR